MEPSSLYYRDVLRSELERRSKRNPRYSLRAFARSLGIDAAALWRVLTGNRGLSMATAEKLAAQVAPTAEARSRFLRSAARDRDGRRLSGASAHDVDAAPAQPVDDPTFAEIADWYHFAILELTYTGHCRNNPEALADLLGLPATTIKKALERLLNLGLLIDQDGRLVKAERRLKATTPEITNEALKRHQGQLLGLAVDALTSASPTKRAFSTLILPTDPALIDTARRMLEDFSWELCRHLTGGRMTEVYGLILGLFPLQRKSHDDPR